MRKARNLDQFQAIIPYASEIFGVYQPLLGWKSKRTITGIQKGFLADKLKIFSKMYEQINPAMKFSQESLAATGAENAVLRLDIDSIRSGAIERVKTDERSFLVDEIGKRMPPEAELSDHDWDEILNEDTLDELLNGRVKNALMEVQTERGFRQTFARGDTDPRISVAKQVAHESRISRYLVELKNAGQYQTLKTMLYGQNQKWLKHLKYLLQYQNPLDMIDPHKDLDRVMVSPLSIVHLFRQYFFEFDSFLGPPVGHVWLSPGSSVELVEVQTRRTLTERTFETEKEITTSTSSELTTQEELSEGIKEDNRNTTKFGFSAKVHQGWVGGSADASSSIDMENTQQKARETTHKHMRQQTERISSEIRKNYKSTFKTVTEETSTSSKRYLLANTTENLINYEMRRKMRQVGVQVQDIGTYLCWQTYVDNPGLQLGVSEMVHLAKSPDLDNVPEPDMIPLPGPYRMTSSHSIPFKPRGDDTDEGDMDEAYYKGVEASQEDLEGEPSKIDWTWRFSVTCDKSNYVFDEDSMTVIVNTGPHDLQVKVEDINVHGKKVDFLVKLIHVNFRNQSPLVVEVQTDWVPEQSYVDKVEAENQAQMDTYNAAAKREFEKAFVEAARERIKLASGIGARRFDDLREEERIVVYRALIQDMLTKDLPLTDSRTQHAVSELLNSIFDVDKMLYFVAPEWWRPRFKSHQDLGAPSGAGSGVAAKPASVYEFKNFKAVLGKSFQLFEMGKQALPSESTVGWGGEYRKHNYYITEESEPARMGASLGWLLQLDGDKQRNAFLNAPWVKAVIPIRPGKEKAAFNWLQRVAVEGADGLDSAYVAPQAELDQIPHSGNTITIKDAILQLCAEVAQKHEQSLSVSKYPTNEINDDNTVSATPVDKVFEHGFYPNEGGFKLLVDEDFEVFDQWVEVLPTDQVVPVEVAYDPKTGRML